MLIVHRPALRSRLFSAILVLLFSISTIHSAHAAIVGLTPGTYTYNDADAGSPPIIGADSIQLTTGGVQHRSIWFNSPQNVSSFTASFTYRSSDIFASFQPQGVTFALQASPAGTAALGLTPPGSGNFGYGGITDSVGVTIELDTGSATSFTGLYTNGVFGGGSASTSPVNAFNDEIDVIISYQGSILSVTMTDGSNTFGPSHYLVGDLQSVIGSPTAYVGFTAATEGGANQHLSNFLFVPEPSSLALFALAGISLVAHAYGLRRRRHTAVA